MNLWHVPWEVAGDIEVAGPGNMGEEKLLLVDYIPDNVIYYVPP